MEGSSRTHSFFRSEPDGQSLSLKGPKATNQPAAAVLAVPGSPSWSLSRLPPCQNPTICRQPDRFMNWRCGKITPAKLPLQSITVALILRALLKEKYTY